jgi:hypothetical protein
MKKSAFLLVSIFILLSCSSTKESASAGSESKKSRKAAEQEAIKQAIESRRYVIKVNRLYTTNGIWDLIPTSNFVIVNGDITSVSLGYMGRSFSRPISGINFNARNSFYKVLNNTSKGNYEIEIEVKYGSDKFDLYVTIGNEGYSNISINNAYIETVRYTGTLEPIPAQKGQKAGSIENVNQVQQTAKFDL